MSRKMKKSEVKQSEDWRENVSKHSSSSSKHILFIVQDIDLMELIHLHMSQFSVEDCKSAGYIKLVFLW